jgi:hypothetical protein
MAGMTDLPATFAATREALHRLACYVIAPAGKARTGHIGLRATGDGFGTPTFADGTRIAVRGTDLLVGDRVAPITTLRDGADLVGIELSPDPGVGADLPPYEPDAALVIDAAAASALAEWLAFGAAALARIAVDDVTEAQLWPEHFDLAVTVTLASGSGVNVGFSAGDAYSAEPTPTSARTTWPVATACSGTRRSGPPVPTVR